MFLSSLLVSAADMCSQVELEQMNKVASNEDLAKEVAQQVLNLSFQKLAYAHHEYNKIKANPKALKAAVQEAIKNDKRKGISSEAIMEDLDEYSNRVLSNDTFKLKKNDQKYLKALTVFSKKFKESKYHIENYEEEALRNFGHLQAGGKKQKQSWKTAIQNIADNFRHRQFKNEDGSRARPDMKISEKKISDPEKIKQAIKAYKNYILENSGEVTQKCRDAILNSNNVICKKENKPLLGINRDTIDFCLHNILKALEDKTVSTRPEVGYIGAKASVQTCEVTRNKEDNTYNISLGLNLENLPSHNEEWSLSVNGSNPQSISNIKDDSGLTTQKISSDLNFNGLTISEEDLIKPLSFKFLSKNNNTMYKLIDNKSNSPGVFLYDCELPKKIEALTVKPVTPPTYKIDLAVKQGSAYNIFILTAGDVTKTATNAQEEVIDSIVTIPKDTKYNWVPISPLICNFAETDTQQKTCTIEAVEAPTSATLKVTLPDEGSVEVVAQKTFGSTSQLKLTLEKKENTDKPFIVDLVANVSREVDGKTEALTKEAIVWKCEPDCEPAGASGTTFNINDTFKYHQKKITACLESNPKICSEQSIEVKLPNLIAITSNGDNKSSEEAVNLKLKDIPEKYKAIMADATFKWSCDLSKCDSDGKSVNLKRNDKKPTKVNLTATIKGITFSASEYTVDRLKKESKDKDKDKEEKEEEEEESDEECTQADAFSVKVCVKKGDKASQLPTKYMPPMQQPLVLPPSRPYITPGFN